MTQYHSGFHTPWVIIMDCFDRGASRVDFVNAYDILTLRGGGGGTNDVTSNISRNTLITGGAIGNSEGTQIIQAVADRGRQFCSEIEVELASVADVEFRFGFWLDVNNYAYIEFDKSLNDNWRLVVNDGGGTEYSSVTVGVVAAGVHYYMRLWLETDGTVHWMVTTDYRDMLGELLTTGISNNLAAGDFYCRYFVTTEANVAKQALVDYLQTAKTKMH